MRTIRLLCWLLLLLGSVHSLSAQQGVQGAYDAQLRGQYAAAVSIYDSLWRAGHESADLHYNLSLAYYRQKDFGRTMLHLEKAARLAPYDRAIRTNLQLLRNEQEDGLLPLPRFFLQKWVLAIAARLAVDTWAALALLLVVLAVGVLLAGLRGWSLPARKFWPLTVSGLLVLSVLFVLLAGYRQAELARTDQAVLLAPEMSPRIAPDAGAETSFTVHAGLRVRILDRFENWIKVQLPDGREGWLPQTEVGEI